MIRQIFRVELLHDKQNEAIAHDIYLALRDLFIESEIYVHLLEVKDNG